MDRVMAAENTGWVGIGEPELRELQRFVEENPEYWRIVMQREPPPSAAREMLDDRPPPEWPSECTRLLALRDARGAMLAVAHVVEGLFAHGIWHVGLFIVAGRLHGTGASAEAYASLEGWMQASGAQWIRLGVVVGNVRAERFWEKMRFVEVRRRYGIELEGGICDLRVMVKALGGGRLEEYLRLVERDRPD
jgi:GNAT superfamily N-acetyltransferase